LKQRTKRASSIEISSLHWRLREALERCLKKDAKDRYHDISDVKADIQRVLTDPSGVLVQPVATIERRNRLRLVLPWVAAGIVLAAIIAGVAVWRLKPSEPRQVTRFAYELPEGQQLGDASQCAIAISPDGSQFVYSTDAGLCLRSMDNMDLRLLPGTGGTNQRPFFSPDGKWIGFLSSADKKLKKLAISSGIPIVLADVGLNGIFDWNANDTIVYGEGPEGILRVSANGGTPEQIIKRAEDDPALLNPQILPDGKKVAITIGYSGGSADIWIWDIVRETMTRLTFNQVSSSPLWFLDGQRIAFWSGSPANTVIYWKAADGTGADEKLGSVPGRALFPSSWSKDGKTLVT
jgi:Tol biopolymer transport system component